MVLVKLFCDVNLKNYHIYQVKFLRALVEMKLAKVSCPEMHHSVR